MALVLVLLAGCDPSGQQDREADGLGEASVAAMVLSATQPISIGGQDEREDYYIGQTVGALRLSDGRIVIGDGMTRQLRMYDRSGRHIRTFGGTGGGPGEFEMLHSVTRMAGDSIVGWDAAQRRATVFTPEGEPAYTISNSAWSAALAEMQKDSPRHLLLPITLHQLTSDHLLIQLTAEPIVSVTAATQILQDTTPLLVLDRHGENWVALGEFPGIELFYHDRTGRVLAVGENTRVAAADDAVYAGSTHARAISQLSPRTGEIIRQIPIPWERRAVSARDREVIGQRIMDRTSPEGRARAAEYTQAIPWPDSLPMFSDLRVSSDQRLWVQKFMAPGDDSQEWYALDSEGQVTGTFTIDAELRVLDLDRDHVLVKVTDELGAEEIRVYNLQPADG